MMYFFLFFILVGFIFIPFFLKEWKLKNKLITSIGFMTISLLAGSLIFVLLWNSSKDSRAEKHFEQEYQENTFKKIYFKNNLKKTILIIINFEYSENEIKNNNLRIVDYYNKKDSLLLDGGQEAFRIIPIFQSDTIQFPSNFSIQIKDSLGKVLKKYGKNEFLNSVEKSKYKNDIECKEEGWTLIIK
jgi:hypothetical protein